jgi:hypothetical protein
MTVTTREVSHVTIVDLHGRITLGEETEKVREVIRGLIAADKKKIEPGACGLSRFLGRRGTGEQLYGGAQCWRGIEAAGAHQEGSRHSLHY